MGYAVELKGLRKAFPLSFRYRDLILHPFRRPMVRVLDGIDLCVNYGELFCLLGPNGAGKTTLIKILTTLVLPTEGEAWVNGVSVLKDADRVKKFIGFSASSERSFYYRLTGLENLSFFASLNGLDGQEVSRVMDWTGIAPLAGRRFSTYSAGERQMLGIARALLGDPLILFFDEPTISLDPLASEKIRDLLKQLVKEGKTVFVATHNLEEAAGLASRLAIIDRGRIKVCGTLAEITENGWRSLLEVFEQAVQGVAG